MKKWKYILLMLVCISSIGSCLINLNQGWKFIDVGEREQTFRYFEEILMTFSASVMGIALLFFPYQCVNWFKSITSPKLRDIIDTWLSQNSWPSPIFVLRLLGLGWLIGSIFTTKHVVMGLWGNFTHFP